MAGQSNRCLPPISADEAAASVLLLLYRALSLRFESSLVALRRHGESPPGIPGGVVLGNEPLLGLYRVIHSVTSHIQRVVFHVCRRGIVRPLYLRDVRVG